MPPDDVAAGRHGPLLGSELARAIKVLTDRQLQAYRYRREGHGWNWIAQRMDVSRQAVIHHVANAERHLGYEPTVTPKQKARYKPAARKRAERDAASAAYHEELLEQALPMPEPAPVCSCANPWPDDFLLV